MWTTNSSCHQPTLPGLEAHCFTTISTIPHEERKRQSSLCAMVVFLTMLNCLPTSLIYADTGISAIVMAICACATVVAIFGVCLRKSLLLMLSVFVKMFYSALLLIVCLELWLGDPTLTSTALQQIKQRNSWPIAIAISQLTIALETCILAKEAQRISQQSSPECQSRMRLGQSSFSDSMRRKPTDAPPSYAIAVTNCNDDQFLPTYGEAISGLKTTVPV